ncbi:PLP-dependent transferase [Meredithblackwellia eburnea MCA 4105]
MTAIATAEGESTTNHETFSLFFYGTLMVPAVLARVIGRPTSAFTSLDALLPDHSRFHVKGEDYPAVIPAVDAEDKVLRRKLDREKGEHEVRGTLVIGLSAEDVEFLDEFEGDEYVRSPITVHPFVPSASTTSSYSASIYLWIPTLYQRLEPSIWSFDSFLRDKAHRWVGAGGDTNPEYKEVDRRRAMKGVITPNEGVEPHGNGNADNKRGEELEAFGREFGVKYWSFEPGWVNLNHGSYGAPPIPVVDRVREIQDQCNRAPDRFMRLEYTALLEETRKQLGELIGSEKEDFVLVENATTGVNTILRSLTTIWEKGDKFLYFSTTIYDACHSTFQHMLDTHPHLSLTLVPITVSYPISHFNLLSALRRTIEEENKKGGGKIRLALVDAISSNPGVIVPWKEVLGVLKEFDIMSLVDAAHEIGQLPVDLRKSQPDFWVSNCHKWLMAHRGAAVVWVAKPYQHLIHSIPTGHSYVIRTPSTASTWTTEFEWNGTIDWSHFLSLPSALEFRKNVCGGEKRIYDWCHALAKEGGRLVAEVLGTDTMENLEGEGELVGTMINVRIPVTHPGPQVPAEQAREILAKQRIFLMKTQIDEYSTMVPVFTHAGKWWTRLSAQVYNEKQDFRDIAKVLKEVCDRCEKEYVV